MLKPLSRSQPIYSHRTPKLILALVRDTARLRVELRGEAVVLLGVLLGLLLHDILSVEISVRGVL